MKGGTRHQPRGEHQQQHPMISVPDALRIVLRQTAAVLMEHEGARLRRSDTVAGVGDETSRPLLDETLGEPVLMSPPGYPPYRASIMDGYAVQTEPTLDQRRRLQQQQREECAEESQQQQQQKWTHVVLDKVYAGDDRKATATATTAKPSSTQGDGDMSSDLPTAYYVTTGAVVPDGYDCVVPVEVCRSETETEASSDRPLRIAVSDSAEVRVGRWIRDTGCDLAAGSEVLPAGHVLDPVSLGLLQQSAAETVSLRRPVRVGVLSTGNELLADCGGVGASRGGGGGAGDWIRNQHIRPGTIPDVNRPVLLSLMRQWRCCEPVDLGLALDDSVESMATAISAAAERCEVIVTTGGISMGETDIVESVLVDRLKGRLHFGRLHMKPGKPTTFVTLPAPTMTPDGEVRNPNATTTRLVFALPGNPVSAAVCLALLVKPCLDLLYDGADVTDAGGDRSVVEIALNRAVENAVVHQEVEATLQHDVKLDPERPEYHRVVVASQGSSSSSSSSRTGTFVASSTGVQRSSRLASLLHSNGLMVLPQARGNRTAARTGESYPVLLLQYNPLCRKVRVCDSVHLNKRKNAGSSSRLAILRAFPPGAADADGNGDAEALAQRVKDALSGSKSGSTTVASTSRYDAAPDETAAAATFAGVCWQAAARADADILVVVACGAVNASASPCFRYFAHLSNALRRSECLVKPADAMALQARKGCAEQDATSALFEVVVGYLKTNGTHHDHQQHHGSMVVFLPESGLDGGLSKVRGLLKHAVHMARGHRPHHHHHHHQHHEKHGHRHKHEHEHGGHGHCHHQHTG